MPSIGTLCTFAIAALLLATMPGPGLLYIAGRTLALGRKQGFASCLGAAVGGAVHVIAGVIGVSALVMQSATAFGVLKFCGGIYLLALAVQTWRSASPANLELPHHAGSIARSFREAVIVEATNPKTAAFFLALIPQFIDLHRGSVGWQFLVLGAISVTLNSAMDVVAVITAGLLRDSLAAHRTAMVWLRKLSAGLLGGLGLSVLLARRPA
jgi:threonine/homoserine/homoserine lactone efflux protein